MLLELINDVALLLALCLLQAINARFFYGKRVIKHLVSGILFGSICVIGMMNPVTIESGAILDPRSVILSMSGLFGGPLAAFTAAAITAGYRLWLGGVGAGIGVAVITVSTLLGLAYRYCRDRGWVNTGVVQLLVFGFILHVVAILLFTLFPKEISREIMSSAAIPFLFVFTLATAFLGLLLQYIENIHQTEIALGLSEARYARVIEGSNQGFWELNLKTQEIKVSPGFESMLGYAEGEMFLRPQDWEWFVNPEDLEMVKELISQHCKDLVPSFKLEVRCRTKSGGLKWILTQGKIVTRDEGGNPLLMSGTHTDISDRKKAEEKLELASLVYQTSSEAMTVTDANGNILAVNPAFTETTGYTHDEVVGKNPRILQSGHHSKAFYEEMWRELNSSGQWQGEIWNRRKNGELFPEWLKINSTFNSDGSAYRRIALFSDITKKKQLEDLLWRQANIDLLTGLPNRRMLLDRLQHEINKAERNKSFMALLFLDLDSFKDVNDTLGHDFGDTLLKEVAQRITDCVRKMDTVARLGGDEFTIIMGDFHSADSVEPVAQKIITALTEPFILGDEMVYISASLGITVYPDDGSKPEDLLKNADQAMYAAKHEGKNTYNYFTPAMQEAAQIRRKLISDLRLALKSNQISVYYQPIVDLKTGRVSKAEALVRWRHPIHGMISPAVFIPLAEETNLIVEIGDYVFKEAAQQVKRLREWHDPQFQISVNKSPVQFRIDESLFQSWFDHLHDLNLSNDGIAIEITEGLLLENNTNTMKRLKIYRESGIQISLDDFGTGYSSLSYLKNFDLDYLKIDQSFVRDLHSDSQDMALCEAIIVMAHKLGMRVIAEGVESETHRQLLLTAGCDFAQGYLFSKPVPADEFDVFLKQGTPV